MTARRKKMLTVGVLLAIVAAAAALGVWRVLGSAPDEVSLADAVADAQTAQADQSGQSGQPESEQIADPSTTAEVDAAGSGNDSAGYVPAYGAEGTAETSETDDEADSGAGEPATAATADGVDGDWEVDAETGSFTLDDATGSFAGFRVEEELARIGAFTAVGRTGDISGTMQISDEYVTAVQVAVDLTTLRTDDSRRDGAVQRALRTSEHPTATFALSEELHIEGAASAGEPFEAAASGELTVNGITRPVSVDIEAQLVGNFIAVVGSIDITFADFEVTVPQVPIVLSAEDHGQMEFQLLFRRR